ncbi:UNVERIFIED_CONTAM: Geranylgeranyl transferase type-2 subunit alpha [Trichonephila clavipes]
MHGRLKVKTSEEQAEAKRREQQEKLKVYVAVTGKVFAKREAKEYDDEGLELTARILEKNPDFYTLWNYRREILLSLKDTKNEEELKKLILLELDLTQNCLKMNPKSYSAWHHRFWSMEFNPEGDWKRELKLCDVFLYQDERNFHCWDYRRQVIKKCNVSCEEEFNYSTDLIEENFSNYSAWHYRSTLLPKLYFDASKGSIKEDALLQEFELIKNAAFTDPDDQSAWFYHRFLLGRINFTNLLIDKIPLEILNLSILKPQNMVVVLLSEPVKVDSGNLLLEVNGKPVSISWQSPDGSFASTLWKSILPTSVEGIENFLHGDGNCEVVVKFLNGKEHSSLSSSINGHKSFTWEKPNRSDVFQSNYNAATKDILERELESCQQLNEIDPNHKWVLFSCVLLMRALNNAAYQKEIAEFLEKLTEVDESRKNYYRDLRSKYIIEDSIGSLPVEAIEMNLSNRKLTHLYHLDQLILIEKIDLSSNNLTSVYPLRYLICVKSIHLDDNQVSSLEGLEDLENLEFLSLRRNCILFVPLISMLSK